MVGKIDVSNSHAESFSINVRLLFGFLLPICLLSSMLVPSHAHLEGATLSETLKISSVEILSEGPFRPGDVIAFKVISDLPLKQRQWVQVTADCLAYPAEWHRETEADFIDKKLVKKGIATAIIASGCTSGEHRVYEVLLSDIENNYTRLTLEDSSLPTFEVRLGHLQDKGQSSLLKSDSLSKLKFPSGIRLKKSSSRTEIITLPRVTDGGQTLEWVTSGPCGLQKLSGSSDLGGVLWASAAGTCVLSVNTPWGSNLYQPLNRAIAIEVFPETAVLCRSKSTKRTTFVDAGPCPKGFKKST
jgi:hypothetical protein